MKIQPSRPPAPVDRLTVGFFPTTQLTAATGWVPGSIIAEVAAGAGVGAARAFDLAPVTEGPAVVPSLPAQAWQRLMANKDQAADGLNLLAAAMDFTEKDTPVAAIAGPLADGLAFTANGVSLAAKLHKEDYWGAAATTIKMTGTVLSLVEEYWAPKNGVLLTASGALKIGGMFVGFIAPEKPATPSASGTAS